MTFAIVEFCDAKRPEYQKQNAAAFDGWRARNKEAIASAEASVDYRSHKEAAQKLVKALVPSENSLQVCADLARQLSSPKSDIQNENAKRPNT